MRVVEYADELCPNQYTLEEKLCWCDEVSAEIGRNIIKQYGVIETAADKSGEITLPSDITFDLVERIIIDGITYRKSDFRSFNLGSKGSSGYIPREKIKVVYLDLPKPIRKTDIRGEFKTGENYIEIENPPFVCGDKLMITKLESAEDNADPSKSVYAYAVEVDETKIVLDRDCIEAETSAILEISRVINDTTVIDSPPYDRMYVEYILSKIALYQHDYAGYNAHMMQYNSLFEAARREYITRSPLLDGMNFRNYGTA